MASIHRDPRGRSPYWYCAFTDPNGKRRFKSTKTEDEDEAGEICRKYEKAAKLGRNLTETQARKILAEIMESAGRRPIKFPSVEDYFQKWLKVKKQGIAPNSYTRYKGVIEAFLDFLGDGRKRFLDHIEPEDVEAFVDAELKAGKRPSTVNVALKQVRGVFEKARLEGKIPLNPAGAIANLKERRTRRKPFTREQIESLYQEASDEWKGMVLLGFSTGARIGDCAAMTWENVDLENGVISYLPDKARNEDEDEVVIVPVFPQLREWLLSQSTSDNPKQPLFPRLFPQARKRDGNVSKKFHRLMAKAGISPDYEEGEASENKGRRVAKQTFHSMRSTFTSEMANEGISPEVRMKMTGHKKEDVHALYTHIDLKPLRAAMKTIKPLKTEGKK